MKPSGDQKSKEYINAFERFDKDYDGFISIDDLAEIMKKIGRPINEGELQDVKGEINPNDNSIFDLKEYMSVMERRNKESN
jgi:Ca2+-binding EF-hand superfamily protein